MTMNIFAKRDYIVEPYSVIIDEEIIKNIQSKIDTWNGKGEIKEVKAASLLEYGCLGEKIEVISKKYAGKGEIFYYCCPSVETVDMYNYKFYEYTQHPLSKLCDTILNDYQALDLSEHIARLLNWTTEDDEEIAFVRQLLSAFKFEKLNINDIVKSDLTLEEKKILLQRIRNAIKNYIPPRQILVAPKDYEEEVKKRINDMELIYSGFYGRELKGEDFKYTLEQKKNIKRRILSNLPNVDTIASL